jgi:hypothetical protein
MLIFPKIQGDTSLATVEAKSPGYEVDTSLHAWRSRGLGLLRVQQKTRLTAVL